MIRYALCAICICLLCGEAVAALASDVSEAIAVVRTVSPTSATSSDARKAWEVLSQADAADLPVILRGMTDGNPAVENWLRMAADAVADRTLEDGQELPVADLVALLADTTVAPRGRRTAFELIERVDANRAHAQLVDMIDDPSLELRYDAIAANLSRVAELSREEKRQEVQRLIQSARNLDQIRECKSLLEEMGEQVDLAKHMGYICSWRVCGIFDNTNRSGFDVAYPPESERPVDFTTNYPGKKDNATWLSEPVATDDELGVIDLNDAIGPEKGAIIYAYTEIEVGKARNAQVRYSTHNATKLWVNGELVASNEVYHAGGEVDQYIADVKLGPGLNTLLLKVCQNEQTEPWAQEWQFQLRLSDGLGGAIDFTPAER